MCYVIKMIPLLASFHINTDGRYISEKHCIVPTTAQHLEWIVQFK